jgi:hypothetical protein
VEDQRRRGRSAPAERFSLLGTEANNRVTSDGLPATEKKGALQRDTGNIEGGIDRGLDLVKDRQAKVRRDVKKIQAVADTLNPAKGFWEERRDEFEQLQQRFSRQKGCVARHIVKFMTSFVVGLSAGPVADMPEENRDLERWFRSRRVISGGLTAVVTRASGSSRKARPWF